MKNSLFKRAIAVAASAPLALTQCLTVANAASINNADITAVANETFTADNSVTLNGTDGLIYIEPGKDDTDKDYYITDGTALADIEEFTADEYTITKDSTWNELVYGKLTSEAGKSGSFSVQDILSEAAKKAGNYKDITSRIAKYVGDVKYTIADNGDITLTCDLSNIAPEFTKSDKVEVAGTFTAVIKASALENSTKLEGTLTFKAADGKEYKGTAIADYFLAKIAEVEEKFGTDTEYAGALNYYKKQLNRAKTWSAKAKSKTTELKEYGTFAEALAAVKASTYGQKAEDKLNKEIPASGSAAASDATVNKYYDKALKLISDNASFTVDITTADLGAFADSLKNITAQLLGGTATFSAEFDDAEKDAVAEYLLSEYGLELTESYKTIDITADYSAVDNGAAAVDVKMQRVVKAVTTTTVSTSSTTSTSTETTSTETETTPTETESSTSTTATGTETTSSETTTRAERKTVANYTIEAKTGFYLNIDEKFNKEQIESVSVSLDDSYVYYDEDDEVVGQDVIVKGEKFDITGKVDFGSATPANVFVKGDYEFAHKVPLFATEDIMDGARKILSAGDKLVKVNGDDVAVVCYVGVKGDGDLNYKADAKDASLVLKWYSAMSVLEDPETTVFSNSNQITELNAEGERVVKENYDENLDQFAAFLCDVDNENAADNWYALKPARKLLATDASFILKMYSSASTGGEVGRTEWNEVLGEKFAKKN